MNNIKDIKNWANQDNNIVAMYDYGSVVYKTTNEKSDRDIIMVVNDINKQNIPENIKADLDINIFSKENFEQMIKNHEISALECLFLETNHIWKSPIIPWDFELHLSTLRQSISSKSSNSWVKAKKKFIVEADYNSYVGQKSAWHAIRMLEFGEQIATQGRITNYSSMNELLPLIIALNSWEKIDEGFRKIYNEQASKFRLVAPKEIAENVMEKTSKIKLN